MKTLLLLVFVFHTYYCIEVKFSQFYFTGIKKIEIPSCKEEPCILRIGQQLPVKVTFDAEFKHDKFGDITDAYVRVYVNYYRDRYQYDFAQHQSLCKMQLIECPIVKKRNYTVDAHLFISTEDTVNRTQTFPETGVKDVYFDVSLVTKDGGDSIGSAIVQINVQY